MTLAEQARMFWSAAYFYRRAPERDRSNAIIVLERVVQIASGTIRDRAANLLREINGTSTNPGRDQG